MGTGYSETAEDFPLVAEDGHCHAARADAHLLNRRRPSPGSHLFKKGAQPSRIRYRGGHHRWQPDLLNVPGQERPRQERENHPARTGCLEGARMAFLRNESDPVRAADRLGTHMLQ